MPKLQSLDKANLHVVRAAINARLEPLLEDLGLSKCQVGNIKYGPDGGTFSVEIQIDQNFSESAKAYNTRQSSIYGFPTNIVDMHFNHKGNTYKITGFNISSGKFPIEALNLATNVGCGFSAEGVKKMLNINLS